MRKAFQVGDRVRIDDGRTAVIIMGKAQASGLYMLEIDGIDNWTKFIWLPKERITLIAA